MSEKSLDTPGYKWIRVNDFDGDDDTSILPYECRSKLILVPIRQQRTHDDILKEYQEKKRQGKTTKST